MERVPIIGQGPSAILGSDPLGALIHKENLGHLFLPQQRLRRVTPEEVNDPRSPWPIGFRPDLSKCLVSDQGCDRGCGDVCKAFLKPKAEARPNRKPVPKRRFVAHNGRTF